MKNFILQNTENKSLNYNLIYIFGSINNRYTNLIIQIYNHPFVIKFKMQ